jgi:hypothetical protein
LLSGRRPNYKLQQSFTSREGDFLRHIVIEIIQHIDQTLYTIRIVGSLPGMWGGTKRQ